MENRSFTLFLILMFIGVLLWNAWQKDYHQPAPQAAAGNANGDEFSADPTIPQSDLPTQPAQPAQSGESERSWSPVQDLPIGQPAADSIIVTTDVLQLHINPVGGTIEKISLLQYPEEIDDPEKVVTLGNQGFSIQSGIGSRDPKIGASHKQRFVAERQEYTLPEGEDELEVRLQLQQNANSPLLVEKIYRLRRDSYLVQLDHEVINQGNQNISAQSYAQMQRRSVSERSFLDPSYTGVVLSGSEDPYIKLDFEDMREQNIAQTDEAGWIAWLQHYFLAAVLPAENCPCSYYTRYVNNGGYIAGSWNRAQSIAPGEKATLTHKLFMGPKEQKRLSQAAENLELTVDFGWLFFISDILFTVLLWLYAIVANWGVAIILLTVIIKLLFFPLTAISYRSMAQMRGVQPKMEALKKRYGDDRAALQQALMRMYKEEKINPLGGCLPILVQIPVFIALYWVLFESVELRQASFALWIKDLSAPDPYFVLPLLMGLSMYVQQKLSPQSPDPMQRKIISFMPIPFTLFTFFFPSGLVLYWVISNAISVLQQWYIYRKLGIKVGAAPAQGGK